MSELLPTRKRFKFDKYASDKKDFFRTGDKSQQFFFGQVPRKTDFSFGATITEGSSAREGRVTEDPPELQQLQENN